MKVICADLVLYQWILPLPLPFTLCCPTTTLADLYLLTDPRRMGVIDQCCCILASFKHYYYNNSAPTSTELQAWNCTQQGTTATASNRSPRCLEEGDRISPLEGCWQLCWNRKVDSVGSPVINVAHLPISWTSSTAQWFEGPPCFYGSWVEDVRAGQFIIFGNLLATAWLSLLLLLLLIASTFWRLLLCADVDSGGNVTSFIEVSGDALKFHKPGQISYVVSNSCLQLLYETLHWLDVRDRVMFKLVVIVHRCLNVALIWKKKFSDTCY